MVKNRGNVSKWLLNAPIVNYVRKVNLVHSAEVHMKCICSAYVMHSAKIVHSAQCSTNSKRHLKKTTNL